MVQPPVTDDEDKTPGARGCLRGCGYTLVILLLLAGIVFVVIPMVVGIFVRKGLTPEEVTQLDEFSTISQNFPESWQSVEPYQPDLIAARDFAEQKRREYMDSVDLKQDTLWVKVTAGENLTQDHLTTIAQRVTSGTEALLAFKKLVERDDFDLNICRRPLSFENHPYGIQEMVRLAGIRAYLQMLDEKWKEAFEFCLLSFHAAKRHEASSYSRHQSAYITINSLYGLISRLVETSTDTLALRYALNSMTSLEPAIFFEVEERRTLLEAIGNLREFKRLGMQVDINPGRPSSYYHVQLLKVRKQYATDMMKKISETDPTYVQYQILAQPEQGFRNGWGRELMYRTMIVPRDRSHLSLLFRAAYDGFRLRLAQRITQLETGELVTSAAQFIPALLPEHERKKFDANHFQWNAAEQKFTSLEAAAIYADHERANTEKAR